MVAVMPSVHNKAVAVANESSGKWKSKPRENASPFDLNVEALL